MNKEFEHQQFAHCESGVVSTLLSNYGLKISEPMAFGITSSLSFVYLPIIKLNGLPLIAYRELPKNIINKISKILGIKIKTEKFKDPISANDRLTQLVEKENKLVGLQTSVYYLPYMPEDMRFHFNAHNLLVYGKNDDKFMISDPVFEETVECKEKDLIKARFAKGVFAPNGFLYYPQEIPTDIDISLAIKKAIRKNAKSMTTPFPFAGVKGMKKLAKKVKSLSKNKDIKFIKLFLTHIVRMQEEIGTGGGGFRFMYSAFLQEAKNYLSQKDTLEEASNLIVQSGDTLREFALLCVQNSKKPENIDFEIIGNKLIEAANLEEKAYNLLKKIE
jgi:hypothetical protein